MYPRILTEFPLVPSGSGLPGYRRTQAPDQEHRQMPNPLIPHITKLLATHLPTRIRQPHQPPNTRKKKMTDAACKGVICTPNDVRTTQARHAGPAPSTRVNRLITRVADSSSKKITARVLSRWDGARVPPSMTSPGAYPPHLYLVSYALGSPIQMGYSETARRQTSVQVGVQVTATSKRRSKKRLDFGESHRWAPFSPICLAAK